MMKKIFLNPRRVNVGRVITENNALVYKSISKGAMWRTTQYGEKAVYRAVARVKPYKPIASGEYRSLWQAKRTKKGGIIGNPTLQAYFVEVGRRPGGKPPLNFDRILQWVIDKKLVQQAERALRKKKAKPLTGVVIPLRGVWEQPMMPRRSSPSGLPRPS